jgi:hypothetical protein
MVDSTLHDAVCVLTDVEAEVLSLREQLRLQAPEREGQAALEEAMRLIEHTRESFAHRPEDMAHGMLLPGRRAQAPGPGDAPMTLDKMAVLHARLKTAQLRVQVCTKGTAFETAAGLVYSAVPECLPCVCVFVLRGS